MGLGAEIIMAVVGLWGVYLRPLLMRYAGEMAEVMGHAMHRIVRGRPSSFVSFDLFQGKINQICNFFFFKNCCFLVYINYFKPK